MTKHLTPKNLLLIYAIGFVLVYGYTFNHWDYGNMADCMAVAERSCFRSPIGGSIVAAVTWPVWLGFVVFHHVATFITRWP